MFARVILAEQSDHLGGRLHVDDDAEIDGKRAGDWLAEQVAALEALDNVTVRLSASVSAAEDHGYTLMFEDRVGRDGPRHRLWRVRAKRVIAASGMIERPIAFANNDLPGVMLASAVRDYVKLWGVSPGKQTLICTTNDDGYRTALALHSAGQGVAAVLDSRTHPVGLLVEKAKDAGIAVHVGTGIGFAKGSSSGVDSIQTISLEHGDEARNTTISCDCVAVAGGWSPVVHLYSHSGGKVVWDESLAAYRPDRERAPRNHEGAAFVRTVGGADGVMLLSEVLKNTRQSIAELLPELGFSAPLLVEPSIFETAEQPSIPVWFTPAPDKYASGAKHFLDQQNDVTVADIRLAAREGFESVEHTKRYTTLGMATDQGKTSNINGHAILADALEKRIAEIGTTTFRPPYTPDCGS